MNKNTKRILALSVMFMFVFMFALQVVSAVTWTITSSEDTAGVNAAIENPAWLFSTVKFFGLGVTWADFIVAMAIILMIFAATFDILGFTAFEKDWVKYLIAGAVAVVFGVTGGVGKFAVGMMKLAGGSVLMATTFSIVAAAVFFFLGSFLKSKRKVWAAKTTAEEAKGGFAKVDVAVEGLGGVADSAQKAAGKKK
ncbi:MAG: hypothetical protein KKF50_01470 [Nanoarchaeota archaeon]|nr:hypothetical protein [Nanoarchaeota archaeon]